MAIFDSSYYTIFVGCETLNAERGEYVNLYLVVGLELGWRMKGFLHRSDYNQRV